MMERAIGMFASIPLLVTKLLKTVDREMFGGSSSSSASAPEAIAADLRSVKTTWDWIEARLSDAETKEIKYKSVKIWLRNLRKLSYDAQDVLDIFDYELLHQEAIAKLQAVFLLQEGHAADFSSWTSNDRLERDDNEVGQGSYSNPPFPLPDCFLEQIEERVRRIRKRFDEIRFHRDALLLREDDGERRCDEDENASRSQTSSCRTDMKLFGREDHLKNLVKHLVNDDGDDGEVGAAVKVMAVVGMAGVGKTALAQHACNDEVVRRHFDARGWVCVQEHFDLVRLTKAVLESFAVDNRDATARDRWCSQARELTQLDPLQNVLAETVKGKKVLLVLDNIWNECPELWDQFLSPLRDASTGSKILITTRNHAVANAVTVIESRIPLGCLSLGDSRKLFRHWALLSRREPQFRQVADGIIIKAGGLPLALKLLGRFLRHENDIDTWKSVLDCDLWEVDEAGKQILEPLLSSYLHLRTALKACFRYWALFPEDHRVDKEEVIRLWMAHDLVHDKQGSPLPEVVGSRYIEELSLRSLLPHPCGNEVTMHPVVHELAKQISGIECRRMVGGQLSMPFREEACHLAILGSSSCEGEANAQLLDPLYCKFLSSIRSLLFFVKPDDVGGLNLTRIPDFANMMSLRVLDLSYSCLKNLPSSIENLKHLRYLKLAGTGLQKLPESVSKLYHLQTLDLGSATCLVQLPSSIGNLKRLRYLNLQNTNIDLDTLPDCIHDLTKRHSLKIESPTSTFVTMQTGIETKGNSSRSMKRRPLTLDDELITNKRLRCSTQNEQGDESF